MIIAWVMGSILGEAKLMVSARLVDGVRPECEG